MNFLMNPLDEFWEYLKCRICKKILDNPKTLSCQHSFCFQCLDNEFCEDSKLFCYIGRLNIWIEYHRVS